jgi:GT2 family glycosyltransferase
MTTLSVVLIGRNEAANIARLLESVLRETGAVDSEVVVVDSASTDGMADIAARFPVDVLRLLPDQPLSAAAGRYVGFEWTKGDHVLFLDGDMELYPGWVDEGLRILEERPDAGAVTGALIEHPPGSATPAPVPPVGGSADEDVREVRFAAGAALYRRTVLDQVGCFNPYLRSDEEPELCLRVRQAGYRVLQTPHPIVYHHGPPSGSLATVVGRWRRGLFLGAGQNLRYLGGTPLLWPYLRERGFGIVPGLVAFAGLAAAGASLGSRRSRWFASWLLLVSGAVGAHLARSGGDVRRTARMVLQRALIAHGTMRGLLMPAPPPASYPARYEVIRSSRG